MGAACTESVLELLLTPLARSKGQVARALNTPAWSILEQLAADTRPLLRASVKRLALNKKLPSGLAANLLAILKPPETGASPAPACPGRQALWEIVLEIGQIDPKEQVRWPARWPGGGRPGGN